MSKNLISSLSIKWKYQRKWVSSDRTLNFQSLCSCTVLTSSAEFCSAPSLKKFKIESYLTGILEDLSLLCTYYSRKWRHIENKVVTGDNQRGFTKKKKNSHKLTNSVDEKREIYLMYLVLCKAFNVLLSILVPKVKIHGFDRWDNTH